MCCGRILAYYVESTNVPRSGTEVNVTTRAIQDAEVVSIAGQVHFTSSIKYFKCSIETCKHTRYIISEDNYFSESLALN